MTEVPSNAVTVTTWTTRDGASGPGHPVALTADSGYFWFFDPSNVEVRARPKVAEAEDLLDREPGNQRAAKLLGGIGQ